MKNDGGPAFPARIPLIYSKEQGKDYPSYEEAGMSLRDYFAAKAMQAFLIRKWSAEQLVKASYAVADAMLEERRK